MYAFFEDAGKLLVGRILSSTDSTSQLELDSGKRLKIKNPLLYIQFPDSMAPGFSEAAQACAQTIDVDLAWEFAPIEEFGFADLAQMYFSTSPSTLELAGTILCLHAAPHYFRRVGKGRYKKADAHTLALALASIEKRKQQQADIEAQAQALCQGQCPPAIQTQIYKILFKPDKNTPEYKAVALAAKWAQKPVLDLLLEAGAIASAFDFHWQRFVWSHFPKGLGFDLGDTSPRPTSQGLDWHSLERADVKAFSIDDSSTTEIDDALSVQGLGTGRVRLGIHIAAPALALKRADTTDALARERLSTVYMPGAKITMLPPEWSETFSLNEGRFCPALSLYADFEEETLAFIEAHSRIEQIWVEANLRHDVLEQHFTHENMPHLATRQDIAFAPELAFLYRLAGDLKAKREEVRGKPEVFSRPDYTFKIEQLHTQEPVPTLPTGNLEQERIHIIPRQRGAPLDLIVAEAMVFVNSHWGQWLGQLGVPAIYRSQANLSPGVKVKMGLRPLPHAGMGVSAYAWCSSPLRRYVDLLNQQQLIACIQHGSTAALAAPYPPKDADLYAIVEQFEETYRSYQMFQQSMERYWTLRYLEQEKIERLDAIHIKEGLCRAAHLPLTFQLPSAQQLARGTAITVRIEGVNLMTLTVHTVLLQVQPRQEAEQTLVELEPEEQDEDELDEPSSDVLTAFENAIEWQEATGAAKSNLSNAVGNELGNTLAGQMAGAEPTSSLAHDNPAKGYPL